MESNIVRKHNDIIEACYDMTTPELRLVYSCISKIGFDETITDKKPFFISATEYSEAFAVDQSHVHREIRKAVNGMWDRELTIHRKDDTPLVCRWIDAKAQYGDGGAEIHFSSHVIPYLTSLREGGNFTIYQLENIGGLKSAYSIRLYELLVQYKTLGSRKIPLDELRKTLCLGDKYGAMSDLKKRVIDLSINEINRHTDLKISYENVKKGRAVTGFIFTIRTKEKPVKTQDKNKKWLTHEEVKAMAQNGKGMSWDQTYDWLESKGYSFKRLKNPR